MNTEELERLADAFFECSLDRHEEIDLARILAFSDVHTPLLDSCRRAMGLEVAVRRLPRKRRVARSVWLSAAASVAVLAVVATAVIMNGKSVDSLNAEVYMSGKRISDKNLARDLGRRDMESELKAFHKAIEEARIQQAQTAREIERTRELIDSVNNNNIINNNTLNQ